MTVNKFLSQKPNIPQILEYVETEAQRIVKERQATREQERRGGVTEV